MIRTQFRAEAARAIRGPVSSADPLAQLAETPGGEELAELVSACFGSASPGQPAIHLLPDLAARLQAPFVIRQVVGRLSRVTDDEIDALVPTDEGQLGRAAWSLACSLLLIRQGLEPCEAPALAERYGQFRQLARNASHDQLSLALLRRAVDLDIPFCRPDPEIPTIQLGQGVFARRAHETMTDGTSHFAVLVAANKRTTINRLRQMGLPTLPSGLARNEDEAAQAALLLDCPVVLKPVNGGKGHGISIDLRSEEDVREAFRKAARTSPVVLVERYAPCEDYRLLVVGGRLVAAARRIPAQVAGDGRSTVAQLIERLNADPRRGTSYAKLLEKVAITPALEKLLARQGLNLASVPPAGQAVKLSLASNISQGGTAEDVADKVHPDNRRAVERAARVLALEVAGVDFLSSDISRSWRDGEGWILEVNTPPGLRPHWIANPAQDVVTPILRQMFPEGARARIPTVGVTGSMGKTTTCQMVAAIARVAGHSPALATTQGGWSGHDRIASGDASGGKAAMNLMTDPDVDMGIFEIARGGLLKQGMVIDGVDVAAILNVSDNHVGRDGIASRQQLAEVKAILARNARRAVLLNADDPLVLAMREVAARARIGLVSVDPGNAAVVRHREQGHCTVTLSRTETGMAIRVDDGGKVVGLLPLAGMPATLGGRSRSVTANAMFAVGIGHFLGLPPASVAEGLQGFVSSPEQNPGRHNRIVGLPYGLILEWADGVVALADLIETLEGEPPVPARHLYLTVPGNRSDEWVRAMGRVAGEGRFDRYYCADMMDLRGRKPGQVPALLAEGLRAAGVTESAIACLDDPHRALPCVLDGIPAGDRLIVIDYESDKALTMIARHRRKLAGQAEGPDA